MSMEGKAVKEFKNLKSENEYLKKTNRCIAKQSVDNKNDLVWVMRDELKVLSAIHSAGGLKQFKLAIYNSLKTEFINSNQSCESILESRIVNLELDNE